jgi:bifunctional ADP-heptose synthase (sugar kinase/adenylyltransferase)
MRVKIFKIESAYSTDSWGDEIVRKIVAERSDWEEVSLDEYTKLVQWTRSHSDYIMVTPDNTDESLITTADILKRLADEEAANAAFLLKRKKQEAALKEKQTRLKTERDLKKLQKMKDRVKELEELGKKYGK